MTIEPHHARTVYIPSAMPPAVDREMTLGEYQANVAARFGNGRLPSWAELARMENAAMIKAGQPHLGAVRSGQVVVSAQRVDALRDAFKTRKAKRVAGILAYLGEYRTSAQIAAHFRLSVETVQSTLKDLKADGLVVMRRTSRMVVWLRAGIPVPVLNAESAQAVSVTVRGKHYPSMSECARHLGVSVQAVCHAVKNNTLHTLGTRPRKPKEGAA